MIKSVFGFLFFVPKLFLYSNIPISLPAWFFLVRSGLVAARGLCPLPALQALKDDRPG